MLTKTLLYGLLLVCVSCQALASVSHAVLGIPANPALDAAANVDAAIFDWVACMLGYGGGRAIEAGTKHVVRRHRAKKAERRAKAAGASPA